MTGHTGFKGAWLVCWLRRLHAVVMGVALQKPVSQPNLWEQLQAEQVHDVRDDLSHDGRWVAAVREFSPHVVLHLAAQPLVSVGWREPAATFATNVNGTVHVLAVTDSLPDVLATVVVTTDKVYDSEQVPPHRENDRLGGTDPYSASKAAAELVVRGWPTGSPTGTARAGNVIGGGDWAPDRLFPDLVRAWIAGRATVLRNPTGVRPWQHVLEPLRGYLLYAEALAMNSTAPRSINFGPSGGQALPVHDVVDLAAECWRALGHALPDPAWTHGDASPFPEAAVLTLDSDLAREALGWEGVLDWRAAVRLTLEWYDAVSSGTPAADLVEQQLERYTATLEVHR